MKEKSTCSFMMLLLLDDYSAEEINTKDVTDQLEYSE